jgi:molecular chaperone HscB
LLYDNIQKQLELAETLSSQVNTAFRTLVDPMSRVTYLLELNGNPLREQDEMLDEEFLLEMYELRERLYEAESPDESEKVMEEVDGMNYFNNVFLYLDIHFRQ